MKIGKFWESSPHLGGELVEVVILTKVPHFFLAPFLTFFKIFFRIHNPHVKNRSACPGEFPKSKTAARHGGFSKRGF